MITVRFATGFSVQYNDATFVDNGENCHRLLTEKGGRIIARVPHDCIVEFVSPCRTYTPIATDSDQVKATIDQLAKDVRSLKREVAKWRKV